MKKVGKIFGGFGISPYLCTRNQATTRLQQCIGIWCNGNTADSGPAFPGSSPGIPTKKSAILKKVALFLCLIIYSRNRQQQNETCTPKEESRSTFPD